MRDEAMQAAGAALDVHATKVREQVGIEPELVIREADTMVRQPPPHRGTGMSTAYRISDVAPNRSMEFRKRVMHPGSSIGLHVIAHDEVYYVVSGEGDVTSDGVTTRVRAQQVAMTFSRGCRRARCASWAGRRPKQRREGRLGTRTVPAPV